MPLWNRFSFVLLAAALCGVLLTSCQTAPRPVVPSTIPVSGDAPTLGEKEKILAAAPSEASVVPKKKRRLLVFSHAWGYRHSAIPYGKAAAWVMGEKTGAFEAVISDDTALFEPENLERFDAVLFNNANNEVFLPEKPGELSPEEQLQARERDARLKRSLVDYLARGGGLAVIHAGVAAFRQWPEYGNIVGARFDNHPWNAGSTVTLKVEEPGHPLSRAFDDSFFVVTDEIYQLKAPYSRDKLRVLLSIDTEKTDMKVNGIHRKDNDFAISWVKSYGKGRVFYCALGHEHDIFWNPVVLHHLLDGIQFTLGDLEADVAPSAKTAVELIRPGQDHVLLPRSNDYLLTNLYNST